jgi:flagellar biosynthesis protein FlhG
LIKILATERREKKFRLLINRALNANEGLDSFKKLTNVVDEFLTVSVDFLGAIPEDPQVARSVRNRVPVSFDAPRSIFSLSLERIGDKLLAGLSGPRIARPWDNESLLVSGRGGVQNV